MDLQILHIWCNMLFSHSVVSEFLLLNGLQHTRLPCPSLSPRVCSNSCPLSQWCHPTISSSVAPVSFCPPCFPAWGSFPVSRLFASGGQNIGASASVLPVNIQDWFPLGLTDLIFLLSKRLPRVFSITTVWKHSAFFMVQLLQLYMTIGKTVALTIWIFVTKVMSLLCHPKGKEMQEGKVVVWGSLTNSWEKKGKAKEKGGRYIQLNAEFQRRAGRKTS